MELSPGLISCGKGVWETGQSMPASSCQKGWKNLSVVHIHFSLIPCEGFTGGMGEALSGIEMNKINKNEEEA